jgi:hypothetical protein
MKWFHEPRRFHSFEEDVRGSHVVGRRSGGIRAIAIETIVGSVGRAHELDTNFVPVASHGGAYRYRQIRALIENGATLPPIALYKLDDRYYVVDTHHRVAAARRLGQRFIDAVVTEFQTATSPRTTPSEMSGAPTSL